MFCDYDMCIKGKGAHTGNELVVTRGWAERNERLLTGINKRGNRGERWEIHTLSEKPEQYSGTRHK